MKIYIASSWRNQHGVEMLTALLRGKGHEVLSWIENCNKEGLKGFDFEQWVKTDEAGSSFSFDISGAMFSDFLIYYGPAGKDACAEMGAAYAMGVPIIALYAKGEDIGLMRKMAKWVHSIDELIEMVDGQLA